jgi:hypothetical protein
MELVSKAGRPNQVVHTAVKFKPKNFQHQAYDTTDTGVQSLLKGPGKTNRWDTYCDAFYSFNGATFNMIVSVFLAIIICVHDANVVTKNKTIVCCICFLILVISIIMRIVFTQSILNSDGKCHAHYFDTHVCLTPHSAATDVHRVDMTLLGISLTASLAALVYLCVFLWRDRDNLD